MRNIHKLLLLTCLLMSLGTQAQKGKTRETEIHYGTFNIRYANGDRGTRHDWKNRRDSLARFVLAQGLDICGMQEVLHEQLLDLQQRLSDYDYVGVGRDDGKTEGEYSPIFFRRSVWKAEKSGTFWLSPTPEVVGSKGWDAALPRIATWALLSNKQTGIRVMTINTHFDHVGNVARVESGKLILLKSRELAGDVPLVLTGDFNVGMESDVYQSITHHPDFPMADTYLVGAPHKGNTHTFHSFAKLSADRCSKIDFIFASPTIRVTSTYIPFEGRQEDDLLMSDHNPVIATLLVK